jgi:pimeloyl-ACP methyl ester carboxylesterase
MFWHLSDHEQVVLVGHSYGGMVISGVADRVPERIRHLVYVDAFLPEDGESLEMLEDSWRSRSKEGFVLPAGGTGGYPTTVPQPLKTFTERIVLKNESARRIPSTYILTVEPGAKEDTFARFAERARGRGWTVHRMEADHSPQRSAPDALAKLLEQIR